MPIAKFQMPDGRIARFEVAEGTTPEQAQAQITQMVAGGLPEQPQAPAQPIPAQPVAPQQPAQAPQVAAASPQPTFAQALSGQVGGISPEQAQAQGAGVLGSLEPIATVATGAAAEPLAGLAGLATLPFADATKAAENIETVKQALTYIPKTPEGMNILKNIASFLEPVTSAFQAAETGLGEAGYDVGGPALGAAAATLPTAALEAIPGVSAVRRGLKAADKTADIARTARKGMEAAEVAKVKERLAKNVADSVNSSKPKTDLGASVGDIKSGDAPEIQNYEQILENLKKKKIKKATLDAMPDNEILKAADELGIDLNPDHYSTNRAFQEVSQSLKSRPGSKLGAIEDKAITDLGKRADDLISDLGGQTDKSLIDIKVKSDIAKTIDSLEKKSDAAYRAVDEAIPKNVKVKPLSSRNYIQSVLSDLGGDRTLLSTAESQLLKVMDKNPTYTALDRLRKDVGNGFRKNMGPFKDDNSGTLKQVYRVLSEDQQGVSDAFGVGADYAAARKLVASRKAIEDTSIKLFGREAQGSIIPKLTASATALTKGDTSKFNLLMDAIPKNRRAEVAATMLNDLFTQGARVKGSLGQGLVKSVEGLNRNIGAKNILFNQLPKGSMERFDKIGRVATGIFKSKALENTSKTARDLISAMDDGGMFSKVYDVGKKAVIAEGVSTSLGMPGVGGASVLGAALAKGRTPASQAADSFITSKKFKDAIERAARTGDPKKADDILKTSKEYKKWKGFLNKTQSANIAATGFIPYITGQIEPVKEEQQQ